MTARPRSVDYDERVNRLLREHSPAPGTNLSKQHIREALGEELWALTWSCREPTLAGLACGRCESCMERSTTHAP